MAESYFRAGDAAPDSFLVASLRNVLAPEYAHLSDAEIADLVEVHFGDSSVEDVENFFKDLGRFARRAGGAVLGAMPTVAPIVGGALGTIVGGPVGTMVGQAAGRMVAGAVGGGGSRRPAKRRVVRRRAAAPAAAPPGALPSARPLPGIPAGGAGAMGARAGRRGGSAAGQLARVLQRPEAQQALSALLSRDPRSVRVGHVAVPPPAFANLIGVLANRAMFEYEATVPAEAHDWSEHLMDDDGALLVDPADPAQRADALLWRLAEAAPRARFDAEADDEWSEAEAMDAMYDEWELLSLEDEY